MHNLINCVTLKHDHGSETRICMLSENNHMKIRMLMLFIVTTFRDLTVYSDVPFTFF